MEEKRPRHSSLKITCVTTAQTIADCEPPRPAASNESGMTQVALAPAPDGAGGGGARLGVGFAQACSQVMGNDYAIVLPQKGRSTEREERGATERRSAAG